MLDKLHAETCTLKMRLVALGMALSPPACIHQNKLKQMHADFIEMAQCLNYEGPQKLLHTSKYVYGQVTGKHFHIQNIEQLSSASASVHTYMSHYFDKSPSARWSH